MARVFRRNEFARLAAGSVLTDLLDQGPLDTQWLAVGGDFRWLPTASVPRAFPSPEFVFVAQGDLNGDGFKDLVVSANDYSLNPTLEIYHGNATGGFDPPLIVNDGIGGPVAIGDVNGDGLADLVIGLNSFTRNIMIIPGNRMNGLGMPYTLPESFLPAGAGLPAVAVGDINGDGRDDLLFSIDDNLGNTGIHVYLQQPNGTLQAAMGRNATSFPRSSSMNAPFILHLNRVSKTGSRVRWNHDLASTRGFPGRIRCTIWWRSASGAPGSVLAI